LSFIDIYCEFITQLDNYVDPATISASASDLRP